MSLFKPKEKPLPTEEKPKGIDELLAPSATQVSSNHIQISQKMIRILFISTYPRDLPSSWFSPIVNLPEQIDISFHIHPQNTGTVLKQLRDRLARMQSQMFEEQEKGKVRDPILETAISDIENLRDRLQQGTEKFFEFGVYLALYGNDVKELDKLEEKVRDILETQLIYLKPSVFRMLDGFKSIAPLGIDQLKVHTSFNTQPLSSSFPFVSYDLTSNTGILYGINTYNNSLVIFDRFSLENYNMVVFGKSGGGKSYAVKLNILREIMFGSQIFVIDPEHEYKYLSETLGGSFVKISIASESHINPFDLPIPQPDESSEDVFKTHILELTGLLRLMLGNLTPEQEAILDQALQETYAMKDITPKSDFSKAQPPLLSDLENILGSMTGAEDLVVRLRKYTKGTFAGFLNQPSNISLDNNLVVFSIRDMEDELKPIAMYLVLNYVWTKVRKELRRRLLVVDEAWWLLKQEAGATFLLNTAKRARKYYLGLTTISQDVPEFLNSPYGKPIITNSSMQLLLKQSSAAIEDIKAVFNLTDTEKESLLAAKVGEGLFFAGPNHIEIRILSSYTEDQIITSDPRQLLEMQQAKEELNK